MSDSGEFKTLVRQRMAATGEKYIVAYRALLEAAASAVLPPGHRVLPRIAARYADEPARPVRVRLRLWEFVNPELDDAELADYLAADEDGRLDLIWGWLTDRLGDLITDEELIREHEVVYEDQLADRHARMEAEYLGITPDQYVWLTERLTDEEFEALSGQEMHRLLAAEYTEYPASPGAGRGR
ncbi:MAG TPA: hypothetical protein VK280_09020 [Streptosporangiaceae bacterium]|nr:hypothetical protein [Streptosporangiaceae bacterium]